jgi:hypothetical protein
MSAPLDEDAVQGLPPWAQAVVHTGVFGGACGVLLEDCKTALTVMMDEDAQAIPGRQPGTSPQTT